MARPTIARTLSPADRRLLIEVERLLVEVRSHAAQARSMRDYFTDGTEAWRQFDDAVEGLEDVAENLDLAARCIEADE